MRIIAKPTFYMSDVEAAYETDANKNGAYMLQRWKPGETPVETYDKQDFIGCLHGCVLALTMLQDSKRTQMAIEDDGIVHELIHILHFTQPDQRIQIGSFRSVRELRDEIYKLQEDGIKAYEQLIQQSEQLAVQRDKERYEGQFFYSAPVHPLYRFKNYKNSEQQGSSEGKKESVEIISTNRVYTDEPIYIKMLQRARQEETSDSTSIDQTGRPDNVRDGELGEVPMQPVRKARKGK